MKRVKKIEAETLADIASQLDLAIKTISPFNVTSNIAKLIKYSKSSSRNKLFEVRRRIDVAQQQLRGAVQSLERFEVAR